MSAQHSLRVERPGRGALQARLADDMRPRSAPGMVS